VKCRFHDLRVTCITKMAESQTPDLVIMSVAGHVSRAMLEHYSRIRTEAKRAALEWLTQPDFRAVCTKTCTNLRRQTQSPLATC
jgi:hypothetical protein